MSRERWEEACGQALLIIGRVSAGVTHELKNKLAVIKEQGSLVQDLAGMARAGRELDPARVEGLSGRLVDQVREADAIIKRLNRFAHSADTPLGCLEATEALGLMTEMHRRLADMKPVILVAESAEKSINVETRPMFLLAALFASLEAAVAAAPGGGEIRARAVEAGAEVRFQFAWEGPGEADPPPYGALLETLLSRVETLRPGPGLSLVVPARFRCGLPGEAAPEV